MRKLVYQVACSLDGYIAGPSGEYDWIPEDPEVDFTKLVARFDTLLMGRTTWETAVTQPDGAPPFGLDTFIVSTTLERAPHPNAQVISSDVEARVAQLKERPGKDIWLFGGSELFGHMLAANLVDSVELAIVPMILGSGIPFAPPSEQRTPLELVSYRMYSRSGIALLRYSVIKAANR
jgi:dihydrofolate reductase